jgi:hypothetical protein
MHLLHRVQTWNCEYEFVFFTSTYVHSCSFPNYLTYKNGHLYAFMLFMNDKLMLDKRRSRNQYCVQ